MPLAPITLATVNWPLADAAGALVWSILTVGVVIAMFMGVAWFKRWLKEADPGPAIGFSLSDLRDLHAQGKITSQEYERAKAITVARVQAAQAAAATKTQPAKR